MYTSATVLHVCAVMKTIGSMTCNMAAWVVDRGVVSVVPE